MQGPDAKGRYMSKDMGSVIVGARDFGNGNNNENGDSLLPLQGDDADKMLQDFRFVVGDYIDCAIMPPLEDGSIAPAVGSGGRLPSMGASFPIGGGGGGGPGMRAFRENGFGRGRPGRGFGRGDSSGFPTGEWKRGERLPDDDRGYGGPRRGSWDLRRGGGRGWDSGRSGRDDGGWDSGRGGEW